MYNAKTARSKSFLTHPKKTHFQLSQCHIDLFNTTSLWSTFQSLVHIHSFLPVSGCQSLKTRLRDYCQKPCIHFEVAETLWFWPTLGILPEFQYVGDVNTELTSSQRLHLELQRVTWLYRLFCSKNTKPRVSDGDYFNHMYTWLKKLASD